MFLKKLLPLTIAATFFISLINAQPLFTYGTKSVNKDEFLKAFNKNPDTTGSRTDKLNEYLDMYVNFKLKIQAAYDEKLNTDPEYISEAENFKAQLAENNINEQANISTLMHEAFVRSQKDILLGEIVVEIAQGTDTLNAYLQIQKALEQLKQGKDFGEVAAAFSTDSSVIKSKGEIGYITVFSLPWQIENKVYALAPGQYSNIYHSNIGYHIFKNISERTAIGKRRIQQVLLPVPNFFTDEEKATVAKTADSLYAAIMNGTASIDAVQQQINPNVSSTVDVGVGEYTADFEQQVFALQNPGDVSKPFLTSYGYHIIKLIEISPVVKDENDVVNSSLLQQTIQNDKRIDIAKDALLNQWMADTKFTAATYKAEDLWKYTDSSLSVSKPIALYKSITAKTVLFSFAKQKITAADWLNFLEESQEDPGNGSNLSKYPDLMNKFIKISCNNYYRSHIEDFYPNITAQMHEFNEANLLFAAMDKHVWSKAANDTLGLKNYYNAHKEKYIWQPGVSALVVAAPSKQIADEIAAKVKANPNNWRNIINDYTSQVNADSSRFENGQLPVTQQVQQQKDFQTEPEKNESGDTYTFVHVFDIFTQPAPRSFDDARGMVLNDYQQVLETRWLTALKQKYPVKINEAVKKSL